MNIPFGNMINFMQQYNRFRSSMQNNADPNKMIQEMMNNGRFSQEQYNNARIMAEQIKGMFKPQN